MDGKYPFETVASFSCNLGFYLDGEKELTCESSGDWNMDMDDPDYPDCRFSK